MYLFSEVFDLKPTSDRGDSDAKAQDALKAAFFSEGLAAASPSETRIDRILKNPAHLSPFLLVRNG